MRRREFITLLSGVAATWPVAAHAQQPDRMRLVGVLETYFAESDSAAQSNITAFRDALAKLGWTEGSNLRIELRWSAGNADRTRMFAKELVDLRPDAILSDSTPAVTALARETRTIPIVFTAVADPVVSGFVQSLAHPGGNLTGFMTQAPAIGGKWAGLLKVNGGRRESLCCRRRRPDEHTAPCARVVGCTNQACAAADDLLLCRF